MKQGESSQDKIYLGLRAAMMELSLAPGEVLHAQEIAGALGVSRTPIREAFIRLQRDGLVNILPQRETAVSRIDLARAQQERFVRESLECSVAAALADRGSVGCLHTMNELIEGQVLAAVENRIDDLHAHDNAFHRLLFEEAGQSFGWELIEQSCPHYHRVRLLSLRSRSVAENVVMDHQELLRALESGQKKRLLEVLTLHLRRLNNDLSVLQGLYPGYFLGAEGAAAP